MATSWRSQRDHLRCLSRPSQTMIHSSTGSTFFHPTKGATCQGPKTIFVVTPENDDTPSTIHNVLDGES
ncbi:hypothetical protein BDD12DRAFT_844727 [Trichophaea hybrida]|nr:hypothetical protein BDD12DRAFT_844727 [Trichophaea hybrida]